MYNIINNIYDLDDRLNDIECQLMYNNLTQEDKKYLVKKYSSTKQSRDEWIDIAINRLNEMKQM